MQKVHVETFSRENSQKINKKINISSSPDFFCFIARFQVLLIYSDKSSKALQKAFYKRSCRNVFLDLATPVTAVFIPV
jgi:hypothetical protein